MHAITRALSQWAGHVVVKAKDEDIALFMEQKIENCDIKELIDTVLKRRIIDSIKSKANGMSVIEPSKRYNFILIPNTGFSCHSYKSILC